MDRRTDGEGEEEGENQDRSKMRMSISSIGDGLRRRKSIKRWGGYPVVVNFHGGGFTLGDPHDDGRWCGTVVEECNAVVVSVDYRLAPEHPFPTAVEDGADAVLWLHKHAEEFGIDSDKICISGFSSGANMAFSVPLRLYDEQSGFARNESVVDAPQQTDGAVGSSAGHVEYRSPETSGATESHDAEPGTSTTHLINQSETAPPPGTGPRKTETTLTEHAIDVANVKIKCVIPWYPSLDYTRTREERRGTCKRADQELPAFFTNLFDDSYLHPPKDVALDSPYLSPGVAPTELLRDALPEEIILHTCEWDMLLDEGEEFHKRLISPEIGKTVHYTMIPGVPHGWDKAPNPWKPTPGVKEHYLEACKEMRRILGQKPDDVRRRKSVVR